MPEREYKAGRYRYGFNGKENDDEVKGVGNQQDYGMRIYDTRIGKFLSVDPITSQYPELTPYQFASNRPIDGIDQDGLEFLSSFNSAQLKRFEAEVQLALPKPRVIEQHILMADIYGNGHIGPESVVRTNVLMIRQKYYNAIADNIAGGPFGAAGYMIGGDKWSFAGASLDGIATSFGGIPAKNSSVFPGRSYRPSILSLGYKGMKPSYTTSPYLEGKIPETFVFQGMPKFNIVDKGSGNIYRTSVLNGVNFEFNTTHSYGRGHLNSKTGQITKFDPNVASVDAVEYSIMQNIQFQQKNLGIQIPSIQGQAGSVLPFEGNTNVNGLNIKYNAVETNGTIKVSNYFIE